MTFLNNSTFDFPGLSKIQIDRLVEKILLQYQPDVLKGIKPFDVYSFIEIIENELDIVFDFISNLPHGIEGCISVLERKVFINASLADDPIQECYLRSTVCHEFGHVILHLPLIENYYKQQNGSFAWLTSAFNKLI